jgi:hypothetical protein
MSGDKTKILYIAGWGRSGSTILDQILGQLEGYFSVGELMELWDRGPQALCGCGRALKDCEFWQRVFAKAFGVSPDRFNFAGAAELKRRCSRSRHLLLLLSPALRPLLKSVLDPYLELTRKFYRAIGEVTGARVIVDSSKQPIHGYVLQLCDMAELVVVHLIRDPRGCAYSLLVSKPHPDPTVGSLDPMHPAKNSLHWVFANAATEAIWKHSSTRYMSLRYEDFAAEPKQAISRIVDLAGEPVSALPFASDHSVLLRPVHGVLGNSVRFRTGLVELKSDDKWRSELKPSHKLLVTAMTIPVLSRYGYSNRS